MRVLENFCWNTVRFWQMLFLWMVQYQWMRLKILYSIMITDFRLNKFLSEGNLWILKNRKTGAQRPC